MYKFYDFPLSGNCYKVRLLLTQLGIPFETINVDILQQETSLPDFLQKNPNGKVPVLEIEPGTFLTESNSILLYLAEGTALLPTAKLDRIQVMQWLFFEQFSLGANLSRPRFWISVTQQAEKFASLIQYHQRLGNVALQVMEQHLAERSFFVNEQYTIADIALYAYTHRATEGGYDMSPFPKIADWCRLVRSQPQYVSLAAI
ncbi:MAG: glutathione S-transferase family protein [Oscillatoriophycideae cyanobacterium NC_groundwater_1537_Pr4_S-0.65um_50_18]|nr:glutathione S-transferase family protein [Oscillatoriophycideae cyanobacterium NC_groundwater_1537_Pr4_S-0.65um_50_18]